MNDNRAPLIAHVIFRLDTGGLENGLVNLINGMPQFRHAIVCIETYTDFRNRIERADVDVISVNRRPGRDLRAYWRLYRIFRALKPDIVHTRNLGALDALIPAWLAGIRRRIHGEHGWDIDDVHGRNRRLRWLRKLHAPLVTEYVTVSIDLKDYLSRKVGVSPRRIRQIYNGVDVDRFRPAEGACHRREMMPQFGDDCILIGTVGRVHPVKNQICLADAFVALIDQSPEFAACARLVIIGDGEQRDAVIKRLGKGGVGDLCWLPGRRDDIPDILRCLDLFVLPSLAEGISNTILEAMASGLPVIATNVGGNPELVVDGKTGSVVPPENSQALADCIRSYVRNPRKRAEQGRAGRSRVETEFDSALMLRRYVELYDDILGRS